MPSYHIRIAGDDMVFCAGHFITLADDECERLHGHTFRVAAEIFGPLDQSQCVVDFVAASGALKSILAELDHLVLLPTEHPTIRVSSRSEEIEVAHGRRRWIFPRDDCRLLPIANTTAEMLAKHVGERLLAALAESGGGNWPGRVRVEIVEGAGASAACELP